MHPNAYNWFQNQLNAYVNLGVKGYRFDRGDEGEPSAQHPLRT